MNQFMKDQEEENDVCVSLLSITTLNIVFSVSYVNYLSPKGLRPVFGLFLKFGQAILVRFLMLNF